MAGSPPQSRPLEETEAQSAPSLQIIAWQNGAPHWPDFLDTKFPEGSSEAAKLSQKKDEFLEKFPAQPAPRAGTSTRPGRAGGLCDFSIDGGAKPVDITREIQPEEVGEADFTQNRYLVWKNCFAVGSLKCVKSTGEGFQIQFHWNLGTICWLSGWAHLMQRAKDLQW